VPSSATVTVNQDGNKVVAELNHVNFAGFTTGDSSFSVSQTGPVACTHGGHGTETSTLTFAMIKDNTAEQVTYTNESHCEGSVLLCKVEYVGTGLRAQNG
jgi:hypothetical protein